MCDEKQCTSSGVCSSFKHLQIFKIDIGVIVQVTCAFEFFPKKTNLIVSFSCRRFGNGIILTIGHIETHFRSFLKYGFFSNTGTVYILSNRHIVKTIVLYVYVELFGTPPNFKSKNTIHHL